jgi:carboxylesterase type B
MLIVNKGTFTKGMILLISFLGILLLIFAEIYPVAGGKKVNGLDFADDLFNKLAKGSSYFIPEVQDHVAQLQGKTVNATIKLKKAENADKASAMLAAAGMTASAKDGAVTVSGPMDKMLNKQLADSDAMYRNDGKALSAAYGMGEKQAMELWWEMNAALVKEMQQKTKQFDEAKIVDQVNKKAIEPAYNFYGIPAEKVMDKLLLMSGLLIFYVVYTMWYGFAIFELFNGIGMTMSKAKVKKEV